jgi:hypothetical protein
MDVRNAEEYRVSADLLNAWTPTNTNSDVPSFMQTTLMLLIFRIDFCENASFIRLRNLVVIAYLLNCLTQTFIKVFVLGAGRNY